MFSFRLSAARGAALFLVLSSCTAIKPERPGFTAERYLSDLEFLAADAQEGRGVATQGIRRAAQHIAKGFKAAGLKPAFNGSYYQPFTAAVGAFPGPETFLEVAGKRIPAEKFTVFGLSSQGAFSAPMIFAGYGITAPEYEYDDYAAIDARGKAVILLRYEPQETSPTSPFDGTQWSEYATFRYKIFNAFRHGAAAVVLVTGPKAHEKQGDELAPTQSDPMAGRGFGLPMFHVQRSYLEPLLAEYGVNLLDIQNTIDAELKPRSFALPFAGSGNADLQRRSFHVFNVGGVLEGEDVEDNIVFGAHYDHLGFGGPYASGGTVDRIHHGADDNASGTAGLMALARWYAEGPKPPVSLVFTAFTAEESGLVGSTYYVQHSSVDLAKTKAMLNMDMIGRLRNQTVTVFGTRSAQGFESLITDTTPAGLYVVQKPEGFGPSDHAPFYGSGVPVMHFFTGSHDSYHKPTDTSEKINVPGTLVVLELVRNIADKIAFGEAPVYIPPEKPQALFVGQDAGPKAAFLGIQPDFAADVTGVRVASVERKSPADGILQPGDQIIGFNGEPIVNYYVLTYWLRHTKPGETAQVLIRRNKILRKESILLGTRR